MKNSCPRGASLLSLLTLVAYLCSHQFASGQTLTVADFETPYYGLKRQGTTAAPKEVPLIVIGWQPKGKGEPQLKADLLEDLFFGSTNSVAHWFAENSNGRYRLVPYPNHPVAGPYESKYDWQLYWRVGPYAIPAPGDPHYYVDPNGQPRYLDDDGFYGGHTHSWAEAIRSADQVIDYSLCDKDGNKRLSADECIIIIVKAQQSSFGTRRGVVGRHVPPEDLVVDGITITTISELYAAPPHDAGDLAVAIEETLHLAANLADQYPDGNYRMANDSRRPGQLALTDAGRRPVHIDPFHKLKWGWLNPQVVNQSGRYTLRDAATTGDALILYRPYIGTKEFFLVENRWRGTSYDRFRSDDRKEGLAIWHCIQDPQLSRDFARRAVHLRRVDPSLDSQGRIQWHLTLYDGSDPLRNAALHDASSPQNLQFRNGVSSMIRIRNISAAGPVMTLDVDVPPREGDITAAEGRVTTIRVHAQGTGYGPPPHRLEEDAVVTLDSLPGIAFGVDLQTRAGQGMFGSLQHAFSEGRRVRLEYRFNGAIGGSVVRVIDVP